MSFFNTLRILCVMLIIILVGLWPHTVQAQTGQLVYPAMGNIDFDQGTIEMWLVPLFDPNRPEADRYWAAHIMRIDQSEDTFFRILWRVRESEAAGRRTGPFISGRTEGGYFTPLHRLWHRVGVDDTGWRKGQARHYAYCWDGNENWVLVDGKEVHRQKLERHHGIHPHEDMKIYFGEPKRNYFAIRDLRISSVPRQPEELGYHYPQGLQPDPLTLLLDPLDSAVEHDGQRVTRPKVMMPSDALDGGRMGESCEFVETERGPAISF